MMQNESLMEEAVSQTNSLLRLIYVAAFCISQYGGTESRCSKPSNPCLGETFEYSTDKWRYIAEQVSHHPPISMGYVDSKDYCMDMCTYVITRFLGKKFEAKPLGKIEIKFKDNEDFFIFDRPNTYAKNIAIGTLYIDHSGESRIENVRTGEYAVIDFKPMGFFSAKEARGKVSAIVYNNLGEKVYEIFGSWASQLSYKKIDSDDEPTLLWEIDKSYLGNKDYYYFSDFAIKLNMLNDKIKKSLPPTDSRFRPDQRLLEEGDIKNADKEKTRVEVKQRKRLKDVKDYKPRYFHKDESHGNALRFEYIGDYWKDKQELNWKDMPDLFGPDE